LRLVYLFILSFIVGVALYSFHNFGFFPIYTGLFFSFVLGVLQIFLRKRIILLVAVVIFASTLGGVRSGLEKLSITSTTLDTLVGKEVSIEGVIIEEPDERERVQRLIVKIDVVSLSALNEKPKLIISVDRFPKFSYGDRIKLVGVLKKPENFSNENDREFDYINYLAKDAIHYTMYFPRVSFIEEGYGNFVKTGLFKLKNFWLSSVEQLIPDPHVSLLGGLVVGAKQSLGDELEDDFRRTGIIHIVVLSGYNVTIVAEAIMRFFSFLPTAFGMSLGAISIIFFAIMTGASATIVRASIMALLVILARATGRTSEATHALFLAGFFMVLHNPMIVLFDPSFQLSFLATLGLIYLAPQIEKYFHLVPTKWQLREFAMATIATQIFVLPLLLFMMGEISLVSLPVNLLILSAIPLTMLLGFLTGVVGFLSPILAFPFTALSFGLLSYELFIVDIFSQLPFASISVSHFSFWLMLAFYTIYGFVLYVVNKKAPT